ncbi:MAG: Ger(x)C family spore germination protein [Bacillota bacterium]|nr:Ger(x)C family spore germination protein [Bacillota bacterium]
MKLKRNWVMYLIVGMVVISSLSGCGGYKDIDKRFFVVAIGIDAAKSHTKKYLISLKFAIPSVEKKPNDFIIVSEEADTMAEAVRIIKTKVDKEVDFSHAKVVVFNEKIVQKKMEPHLIYWFSRRRDIQKILWTVIGRPTALEVLKTKPKFEQIPSNSMFLALGKEGTETPYIFGEYLFDFKKRLIEKGLDPFMPIIEVKKGLLVINTAGLFNKKRLKMVLTPEQTKLLYYIFNSEQKSAIKVKSRKLYFIIDTQKIKSSYKMDTSNPNHSIIKTKIKIKGRLEEAMFSPKNSELPAYEKLAEKDIDKQVKNLLLKLQKANLDPIGFGLYYRARHFQNNDWKTWQHIYPNLTFEVHTDVHIEDTGLIE